MNARVHETIGGRRGFFAGLTGAGLASLAHAFFGRRNALAQDASERFAIPIATEHGVVADGSIDNSATFGRLFDQYGETGATVILPPGEYRVDGRLTVPRHITLAISRGARLTGKATVRFEGSVEAGLYQIFDGVRVNFRHGSVQCVFPQWWGAQGDGVHDDTDALQSALDARIVSIPAGKYRTTRGLMIRNRSMIVGVGNTWSPTATNDSWIHYDGPEDPRAAVLRASTAGVGVEPRSALTNVHLEKVVLDGGRRAGYGLYSVYCSDDSTFTDITATHCTEHGMFVSQQWYSTYRNLVARRNSGCGITIGRIFPGWRGRGVNGVQFSNIRAHRNGSDKRFHEKEMRDWGYGVLFRPGGGSSLHNVVSEKNYGAGLIYDLGRSCSHRVEGGYLEMNGVEARTDGVATRPWGLIVIGSGWSRANAVSSIYLHGEVGDQRAQAIWLTGDAPTGDLVLRDLSVGHYVHAEWDRYRFEGFVYYGLRNNVIGAKPRRSGSRAGANGA